MTVRGFAKTAAFMMFLAFLGVAPVRTFGESQESAAATAHAQPAKETHDAAGEEEHADLKHSAAIQYVATKTGLTVHQAHMAIVSANFLIIVFLTYWFARKIVPAALRNRTESIQRALEEGRAASADANRRLAEIEARLSKLDTEIAQMQSQSEKEAAAEEGRVKQAAEEDIRKVVQAAEQEIASAAKQARRELSSHTADLAVALARKQIQVDSATDQALVRNFAGKLSSGSGGSGSGPGTGKDRQ